ncbi:hypothetical protein [Dankookia sp. P2]|uniref:hypothetical protein n=1 Tax=Dankookia sp. P2 TaxID=3423955 RepID=UPI003D67D3D3
MPSSSADRLMAERPSLMRHVTITAGFAAGAMIALALTVLTPATAQTTCETKRQSCVAECNARYFTVDPNRDKCLASCAAEANRCSREQQGRTQDQGRRFPALSSN